jgi:hypothetical protein
VCAQNVNNGGIAQEFKHRNGRHVICCPACDQRFHSPAMARAHYVIAWTREYYNNDLANLTALQYLVSMYEPADFFIHQSVIQYEGKMAPLAEFDPQIADLPFALKNHLRVVYLFHLARNEPLPQVP